MRWSYLDGLISTGEFDLCPLELDLFQNAEVLDNRAETGKHRFIEFQRFYLKFMHLESLRH